MGIRPPFTDEELKSDCGYPGGWRLKPCSEQLEILTDPSFPFTHHKPDAVNKWLKGDDSAIPYGQKLRVLAKQDMISEKGMTDRWERPLHFCDGVVIIPEPSFIAWGRLGQLVQAYSPATVLMTELLTKHLKGFRNYRNQCLDSEWLHLTEKTHRALSQREADTPGGFLVLPVQTGLRFRGCSVRRSQATMSDKEWGLGPYGTGIILLVHPERLQKDEYLGIDCAGCEYSADGGDVFSECLYFDYCVSGPRLDCDCVEITEEEYGSVSVLW